MNNQDGALNFAVGLDNRKLITDAQATKIALKGIGDQATAQGSRMSNAFQNANGMLGMFAMGGVASIGILGKTILDTTAKFEKFGIVLRNTLGNTKGTEALAMIANFAATTPFQLDEVTGAFIKMANQGFVPTQQEMVKLGDLASSTGKSFDQLGEALLDAQTGQFERLKEFGIKASANGDRVTFSFKEQKTTVENTNSAIQAYILSLGTLKGVAGANEKISASLTGQMSNLGDKLAAMYNKVGTANKGFLYTAVGGASALIENYETVGEAIGVLIGIYGVQKVATMAVAYTEGIKQAAIARSIAVEAEYAAIMATKNMITIQQAGKEAVLIATQEARVLATNHVILAEERLAATSKASALANPYVLAAMAVAALGYAIYKVVTYQTDLEKATAKAQVEIENEKDNAAQLFAELKHTTEQTEEWKKAKQAILDQYGSYLTEQQKELIGTQQIGEAYATVNGEIEKNIALKTQRDALAAISSKYNPDITEAQESINSMVNKSLGRDRAATVKQDLAPLIANVKIAVDPEAKAKATSELSEYFKKLRIELAEGKKVYNGNDIALAQDRITQALKGYVEESESTINAFKAQEKKIDAAAEKPILTTYAAQIEAIKKKKAKAEAELKELELTPGVNPMKSIVAKKGEIDEYNKQLGIKEKAAKDEKEAVKTTIQASKEYLAIQAQILAKVKELDAANAAKSTNAGLQISKEIAGLQKQLDAMEKGTPIKPLSGKIQVTADGKEQLKASKQITEEQKKQLEIASEKSSVAASDFKTQTEIDKERAGYFYDVADSADYLAKSLGESNAELAGMLGAVANMAGQLGNLAEKGFEISKSEGIGMAISGATQLVGMAISQAAENKRVMKDYYASIIDQQQDYNILLNEQLRLNSDIKGSVFITDYEGSLNDSTAAFNDAQAKYATELKKFSDAEAIVGKKNVVSGKNVLGGIGAGAAMGAGIGAILGGGVLSLPAAAAGAIIGSVVGALTGLFAKKKKDIVAPLLETYPDLIKANGEFNAELAKTLVANNQVTEATKQTLNNLIEWKDAADKATAQLVQVISELTGSLGNDLRDALVNAFVDGTSAAKAFEGSVSKVLENIMSNMIFNKAFEGAFSALEVDMKKSYATGGDSTWLDDFQKFYAESPELINVFTQGMTDAQAAAKAAGFDIFGNTSTRAGSSKGITSMNQDSADELNGRFTAIQGHTYSISEGIKILQTNSAGILFNVILIKGHTESMQTDIGAIKDGIESINLKGITLKK